MKLIKSLIFCLRLDSCSVSNTVLNQYAVRGLMARVYLEMGDYLKAAKYANEARSGVFTLMDESAYLSGFSSISNSEWMFGSDITSETHTTYASFISHIDNTNGGYAGLLGVYKSIDKSLYESISDTDYRKKVFNDPDQTLNTSLPSYANLKFRGPSNAFFEADGSNHRADAMFDIYAGDSRFWYEIPETEIDSNDRFYELN